jgi:hypothetical protein
MAYRDWCAAPHLFRRRHDCMLQKLRRGNGLHSFSLLREMEFRRSSGAPAHSRFCSQRRTRTVDAHGCSDFILFHSATRL